MSDKKKAPAKTEEANEAKEVKQTENKAEPEEANSAERIRINPRKLKHGALSAVLTVLFIAGVVVLNIIVGVISDRVNTAADLTAGNIYSLDEKTKSYLNDSLENDVTITVMNPEQAFEDQDASYKQVNEILKRMAMESPHVTVNYLDIDQNPNFTSRFKGETLYQNYIVVECGKTGRHRIISPYDYFLFNQTYLQYYGAYVVEGSNIEQETVSAMMYTTNENTVRVAFSEGYTESDSTALQTLLSKNGFDVETVNLATSEIDGDADYVVIFAPTIDMDTAALSKLDKFLDNNGKFGKNVIYFASRYQPETPNIDGFLRDWGLSVGYELIGQSDETYLTSTQTLFAHLQSICDTDYTSAVYGSRLLTLGAYLRPVYLLESGGADRTALMKTFDGAFAYPLDMELAEQFSYDRAERKTFNDVVTAEKVTSSGGVSRVCAIGSEQLASNGLMSYNNANNADFFVGMFNYISGREQGMTIKSKSLTPVMFEMNAKTANTLSVVLCVIVPVAVIALGIVIWVRRRHR